MTLSMYSASLPVFTQMLNSLGSVLAKAEAQAAAKNIAPEVYLQSRLFPDMFPLTRQVQIAADFAKGVMCRLAGNEPPAFEDTETSFAELRARIDKTLSLIQTLTAAQIDGSETREIILRPGTPKEMKMNGQTYLLHYGLPQFFFHVTTAYAILRHHGVEIGKRDFMGSF